MATIANQWSVSATNDYGLQAVAVSNTPGNALIAIVGWNAAETNPVANVADDANDWWIPLGTSSASGNTRCSIWIAPNTRSGGPGTNGGASVVSIAHSWFTLGMAAAVIEVSGMANFAVSDISFTTFNNSANSLTLSGTATVSDFAFAVLCSGNNTATITSPGAPWTALNTVSINDPGGAGGPADTKISPVWSSPAAGAVSAAYSASANIPLSGVLVAVKQSAPAPAQVNANWPVVKVEAAFGFSPGDPTAMPTWTDVTARTLAGEGGQLISTSRGRAYELTQTEAGTVKIAFDNHDGAFTPGNSASPYSPNVLVNTPIRVSAVWNNITYPVGAGFMERWPQEWPDMPQWGLSRSVAADSLGVLASTRIVSAYGGEVLIDSPYAYWPCSENYPAGTSGNSGAQGLPLSNLSRSNQRPAICMNGVSRSGSYPSGTGFTYHYLNTGLTVGMSGNTATSAFVTTGGGRVILVPTPSTVLAGDSGTGIGLSGNATHSLANSPGAVYLDPGLPNVASSGNGVTLEFWAILPTTLSQGEVTDLIRIDGPHCNYQDITSTPDRVRVVFIAGASATLSVYFGGYTGSGTSSTIAYNFAAADGLLHHYVITIANASGTCTGTLYIDGTSRQSATISATGFAAADWNFLGIGPVQGPNGVGALTGYTCFNYTIAQVAYYNSSLPAARIKAHYTAGNTAWSGDTAPQRVARLLTWGGFGIARAGDAGSPNPILGPADQVQTQSVTQAAYTVAQAEGGWFYCDGAGNATYRSRANLYNRPVKFTFGDNPPGGEVPYLQDQSFGYDNSFIYNIATSTRSSSALNFGGSYTAADTTSENEYFTRGPLQSYPETTSEQDPQDIANWQLAKYKQPSIRVEKIVIEPSSHTDAWPAALGTEQGDVIKVIRRPVGGATITQTCLVQKVSHTVSPLSWRTTIIAIPYTPDGAVLQTSVAGFDVAGNNCLAW